MGIHTLYMHTLSVSVSFSVPFSLSLALSVSRSRSRSRALSLTYTNQGAGVENVVLAEDVLFIRSNHAQSENGLRVATERHKRHPTN